MENTYDFLMSSNTILIILLVLIVIIILILVFTIMTFVSTGKKNDETRMIFDRVNTLEKNVIKESNENFIKIINQNNDHSFNLSKNMQESLDKINKTNEEKLDEIRSSNEKKLELIEKNINEKLDISLNERIDNSFKTIGEQLQNLQVTNGKLLEMSGTIDDLQKSLSNVKTRGVFGEKQLENILENIMTKNMYVTQFKIKNDENKLVDFAIKIPNKDDDGFVYLPIDSKFPNDRYMDVVYASNKRDVDALNAARKQLEIAVLNQAKSIKEKYIDPPTTTEFAIMFLPTEGLYAECLRIDELADSCQKKYSVLLAGPTTITALINSFSIGFKFLMINKSSKEIAKTLQAIKSQYDIFDREIETTKNSIASAAKATDNLAKRNEMISKKLKKFDTINEIEANEVLGLNEE